MSLNKHTESFTQHSSLFLIWHPDSTLAKNISKISKINILKVIWGDKRQNNDVYTKGLSLLFVPQTIIISESDSYLMSSSPSPPVHHYRSFPHNKTYFNWHQYTGYCVGVMHIHKATEKNVRFTIKLNDQVHQIHLKHCLNLKYQSKY